MLFRSNPAVKENLRQQRIKNQNSQSASGNKSIEKKSIKKSQAHSINRDKFQDPKEDLKKSGTVGRRQPPPVKKEIKKSGLKSRSENVKAQYKTEGVKSNDQSPDVDSKVSKNMSDADDDKDLEVAAVAEDDDEDQQEVLQKPIKKDVVKKSRTVGSRKPIAKPAKKAPSPPPEEEDENEEEYVEDDNAEEEEEVKQVPARKIRKDDNLNKPKPGRQAKPQEDPKKPTKPRKGYRQATDE